jgi:hypothetical protein
VWRLYPLQGDRRAWGLPAQNGRGFLGSENFNPTRSKRRSWRWPVVKVGRLEAALSRFGVIMYLPSQTAPVTFRGPGAAEKNGAGVGPRRPARERVRGEAAPRAGTHPPTARPRSRRSSQERKADRRCIPRRPMKCTTRTASRACMRSRTPSRWGAGRRPHCRARGTTRPGTPRAAEPPREADDATCERWRRPVGGPSSPGAPGCATRPPPTAQPRQRPLDAPFPDGRVADLPLRTGPGTLPCARGRGRAGSTSPSRGPV